MRQPYIGVIGPSEATEDEYADAREVGVLLAGAGAVVVCGGHDGVMRAVCEGAAGRGGVAVGILPGLDRHEGNPFLTIAIATGLGELRNGLIVRATDGLIAIGSSWGTLSEISLAHRAGKPLVAIGGWHVSPDPAVASLIRTVADPRAAVEAVLSAIAEA